MLEAQEFSREMITKFLSQQKEMTDLLQLLLMSADDTEGSLRAIKEGMSAIKQDTEAINSKIDIVLQKLDSLEADFSELKSENRELDQKIQLMTSKLSKMETALDDGELEDYSALCQSLYSNWDELDSLTQKMIPVAEYLFSKLQKYGKPDYSPVILELCRALENEFLLKIFRKYTFNVLSRFNRNSLYNFLATDKSDEDLLQKTGQFVKAIQKASHTRKAEYTLGQMNTIMSLLTDNQTVRISPLLQDFKAYLESETVARDLLNVRYIQSINRLVEDYRNPSAHPGFMPLDKAKRCKEIMPERIDYLMDCLSV